MKKYLETYYRGIINGLGFLTVIGITGVAYGAYVSMTDVNNGETLTASKFNIVQENIRTLKTTVDGLSNVPAGAVMAFNLSTCPSGWIAANGASGTPDLRGEFIRGLDSGRGFDSGRVLGSTQNPTRIRSLIDNFNGYPIGHFILSAWNIETQGGNSNTPEGTITPNSTLSNTTYYSTSGSSNAGMGDNYSFAVRPSNVALLYCVKQ